MPSRPAIRAVYLNGKQSKVTAGRLDFDGLDWSRPNVLALVMPAADDLLGFPEFESGLTRYRLGSWTGTGLAYYSGEAAYERTFDLDAALAGRQLELDLGEVGVTAELWVNGRKVGERVWSPFRFNVNGLLKPGRNHLRILVTNSDANARAAATEERYGERTRPSSGATTYLDSLGLNGLIGPVRLLPYQEIELELRAK